MLIVLLAAFEVRAASVYVRDIKVEGLERVEVETVLSYVDIKRTPLLMMPNGCLPETALCYRPVQRCFS